MMLIRRSADGAFFLQMNKEELVLLYGLAPSIKCWEKCINWNMCLKKNRSFCGEIIDTLQRDVERIFEDGTTHQQIHSEEP